MSYEYATHSRTGGGLVKQVISPSTAAGNGEWVKIYTDMLGRTIREEYPSNLSEGLELDAKAWVYYSPNAARGLRGMLLMRRDPDGVTVTYGYNAEGEINQTTESMPQSQNRVTITARDVINDTELGICRRTTTTINGVETNVSLRSGDGYRSRSTSFGRVTTTVRTISDSSGNATVTTTHPDQTQSVTTITGNLRIESALLDSASNEVSSTTYNYDALRRVLSSADSRTGITWFTDLHDDDEDPATPEVRKDLALMTEAESPRYLEDPGNRVTTFTYDVMGRRISVDAPNTTDAASTTLANITYTSYYPTGQVKAVWGDQTYATFRLYDEQNRPIELRTYRSLAHGTEPTAATNAYDSTTWNGRGQS